MGPNRKCFTYEQYSNKHNIRVLKYPLYKKTLADKNREIIARL